jgi:hypothetical protein
MHQISETFARLAVGKAPGRVAIALLFAAALFQADAARAAHGGGGGGSHGGGGFHGGGFGGFHGGGFHNGWHGGVAAFHNGLGDRGGGWHHGWRGGRYGWWWGGGLGSVFYPDGFGYYPDNGYYDYGEPYAAQYWYYCSDPAGYYPYVTQCNTGWQPVPAS